MILRKILRIFATVYILLFLLLCIFQRSFLYFPSHTYVSPSAAHANRAFKEMSVKTDGGLNLVAWYAPATSKPFTFVFFHGNGDNLATASDVAEPYIDAGYGFLVAEYRGYSGLPGKPTEAGLYADARAEIKGLMAQGVRSESILLFGHSLGTGVATQMAQEFHVGGLILLAPYLSIPDVAQYHYPFYPVKYVVLDRFENAGKIGNIHVPLLIVNGDKDQVIPPGQGKLLFAKANQPREFHSLAGDGHNDLFDDFSPIGLEWAGRLQKKN
jgi:fermentation-respiration switch protein FrsA (DUF1100 family)